MGNRALTQESWKFEARSRAVPFLGIVQTVLGFTEHWKVEYRGIPGHLCPNIFRGDADCNGQKEAK